MKTKVFIGAALAFTLLFTACNKNSNNEKNVANGFPSGNEKDFKAQKKNGKGINEIELGSDNKVTYDSLKLFLTPNYETEIPDAEASKGTGAKAVSVSDSKTENVIPGLRKLSDYITNYTSQRKITFKAPELTGEEEKVDSSKAFKIEDWGPKRKILATNDNPSFYVVFSQPVHALSAVEEPTDKSDILTIEPAIKGVFRWYGTKHLAFEASEPADPAVEYKLIVNPETKTITGAKLEGKTTFKTKAEQVKLLNLYGGYIENGSYAYDSYSGALPPYESRFIIRTNFMLTQESIDSMLSVKLGFKDANFKAEPVYEQLLNKYGWSNFTTNFNKEDKKTDTFLVSITDEVPHNASVSATIKNSERTYSYLTLLPLKILDVPESTGYTYGNKSFPITLHFNQVINKDTIADNISFDFDYKLTEENYEITGTRITLFNLPINFGETHEITIANQLQDIYGQTFDNDGKVYKAKFSVPTAPSYVKFMDYGQRMLEAQFPHKMIFEHQNLEPKSYYKVTSSPNPINFLSEFSEKQEQLPEGTVTIPTDKRNERQFEEVDFEPYLTNGYGTVKFDSMITTKYWDYWDEVWDYNTNFHTMTVQVTDLGITARLGINKAVFMVRSLTTGKPVEKANVHVVLPKETSDFDMEMELASGKTDANGLCVINFTEEQITKYEKHFEDTYKDYFYVMVENGDDKAMFRPDSHSTWGFDVRTEYTKTARAPSQRTYMFVDRGLYKPGETVTFRGIDRDQLLGIYKPHQSDFHITVEGTWWDAPTILELEGTSTESGGFYDSFQLPEDIEPGTYEIKFERTGESSNNKYESITFTVAAFERLKYQASITTPELTFYGGNKLSANLFAEYLAGGVLNGASYSSTWFKQGKNFVSTQPETAGYRFGPYDQYSWRNTYSQENGTLSSNGTAQLNCSSEKIKDGLLYEYRVEATVTDVSNQSITASQTISVHPAQFYIGLKSAGISGFPKKNQKLSIPYALCNTDGKLLQTSEITTKVAELTYKLTRDEWTMIHEQSVYDDIYTRYEKTSVEESTGDVVITSAGNLEITPTNTGWYTLEVSGKDKKGNPVITTIGFYVTGSGMSWFGNNNSEELTLIPNQSMYNPGETAQLLLQSPLQKGDYLITVEREGIFTEEIRHFDEPAGVIEIPIASNYVPVVYVSVSSYSDRNGAPTHQYGEADLDKPKGYYGVVALSVNPYVRSFTIDVECNKKSYRPGEEATITLKATKGGKPVHGAELTLMAVDRGVLDLIDYHVPDPISFFYADWRFPLRVSGGDSRALLMDPVTYSVKNLAGGDAAGASDETKEDERKDFRPTAVFEPVVYTDENGIAKVTFKLPDSLTTYRITAFGVKDDLLALVEDETKVQNPINIQQVQPRRLRERDTAECGVLITNLDSEAQKVTVSLEVKTPTKNTKEDELAGRKTVPGKAFVDGKSEHTITVGSGNSSVVYFDVGAEKQGTVELVYTINSDILNEKLVSPIKIEKQYITEVSTMIGATGDEVPATAEDFVVIPGFAEDGVGELKITLDPTRLGMLGTSVNYLFSYPYGCLEQQSSKVLPLVIFGDYIDVFGLDSEVKNIKTCVTSFTKDWSKSQLENGGFPYWPGNKQDSLYVSLRIAHICGAALQRGYTDKELGLDISKLITYITEKINDKDTTSDYLKAYACYVVKLLDHHNLDGVLANLYGMRNNGDLSLSTLAYVSLAYAADNGLSSFTKSGEINEIIRAYLVPVERSVTILDSNYIWEWYQSNTETAALLLQSFVTVDPNDTMVDRLLTSLMDTQKTGYWQNTATTSRVLEAIYTLIKMRNLDMTDFTGNAYINNEKIMSDSFKGAGAKPVSSTISFKGDKLKDLERDKLIPMTFEKDGDGQLYYTVEMKYALPVEMQCARDMGIKVIYELTDYETGEPVQTVGIENPSLELETGKLYKATIRLEANRDLSFVALRAPIPSGAEILDSTFVTTSSAASIVNYDEDYYRYWISNKNIYDNEIQFFWDRFYTGSTSVQFTFRTARRGVYPTPPATAECMYEPEIYGRSDGYLIMIK